MDGQRADEPRGAECCKGLLAVRLGSTASSSRHTLEHMLSLEVIYCMKIEGGV